MGLFNTDSKSHSEPPSTDGEWDEYLSQMDGSQAEAATGMFKDMNETLGDTINTLEDTKVIGAKTLEELESQGEHLKGIDKGVNDIRKDNYDNERKIRGLTIWGKFKNLFLKWSCMKPKDDKWTDSTKKSNRRKFKRTRAKHDTHSSSDSDIEGSTPLYDLYKKNEQGLDRASDLTQDLEDMAVKMGETIENQNENLDRILVNADKAIEEMMSNTDRANKALT